MKRIFLLLFALTSHVLVMAQQSETRSLGSFKGIKVGEGIDVYLKKGDKESAKVTVDGSASVSDVLTDVAAGSLRIHLRSGNYHGRMDVKVYVTYVDIQKISASSAANVFSEEAIKTSNLDVHASSAANVELSVEADVLTVHASSAGEVTLEGKAKSVEIEASSAGEIDAYNLQSESADGSASSAGTIKLNVSSSLVANASSGGSIRYRGNPTKTNTNSSSGGSVKKAN